MCQLYSVNFKNNQDDSDFPNGVCKQCHEPVTVLIRKNELNKGGIRYACKQWGYVSKKQLKKRSILNIVLT